MSDVEKHQDGDFGSKPPTLTNDDRLWTPEALARQAKTGGGENTVRAGRFVLDPAESRVEYGDEITEKLCVVLSSARCRAPSPLTRRAQ